MSPATHPDFGHVDTWIFDLDLTLYAPEHNIMEQVRNRIAAFVEDYFKVDGERAHQIRYDYWRKYGTTLGGLMAEHAVDPHGYLDFVHDVAVLVWEGGIMGTSFCQSGLHLAHSL